MINIHKISYVMPLVDGTRQSLIILIVIGLLLQYFYIRSPGMWEHVLEVWQCHCNWWPLHEYAACVQK